MSCQAYWSKGFAQVANNPQAQRQLNAVKNARIVGRRGNAVHASVRYMIPGSSVPLFVNLGNINGKWLVNSYTSTPAG
jgi:hypothetical protein